MSKIGQVERTIQKVNSIELFVFMSKIGLVKRTIQKFKFYV